MVTTLQIKVRKGPCVDEHGSARTAQISVSHFSDVKPDALPKSA